MTILDNHRVSEGLQLAGQLMDVGIRSRRFLQVPFIIQVEYFHSLPLASTAPNAPGTTNSSESVDCPLFRKRDRPGRRQPAVQGWHGGALPDLPTPESLDIVADSGRVDRASKLVLRFDRPAHRHDDEDVLSRSMSGADHAFQESGASIEQEEGGGGVEIPDALGAQHDVLGG